MSLRYRLLLVLLSAVAITTATATGAIYFWARHEIDTLFDYQLRQQALALRDKAYMLGEVVVPEPDPEQHFVIQAWDWRGQRVYLSHHAVVLPRSTELGFADVKSQGTDWRVYTITLGRQLVQVAQPMSLRHQIAAHTALRILYPLLGVLPILAGLIWWSVGRELAPFGKLARTIAARDTQDFKPIVGHQLPSEARLMVEALNSLISRLQQALVRQRDFTADAAHELRTPLTALRLQTQLLERAETEPDRGEAILALKAGVTRATHLVERLLTLARLEPDAALSGSIPIDLSGLAKHVVSDLAPVAAQAGQTFDHTIAPGLTIEGSESGLRSLLTNLLDNALRYTPNGGRIALDLSRESTHAIVRISDTGPGIPAADRARIFDRFYRATNSGAAGSGLGLAIVQRVVEMQRGTIEVASGVGGVGAVFTVRLPLRA